MLPNEQYELMNHRCDISFAAESEVAALEEVKKVKEAEIEKYKKYLSKAKKIIESFGGSAKSAPEDSLEVRRRGSSSMALCTCACP